MTATADDAPGKAEIVGLGAGGLGAGLGVVRRPSPFWLNDTKFLVISYADSS